MAVDHLGVIVLAIAWLVLVPRLAFRLAARRGSPAERISAAWVRCCGRAAARRRAGARGAPLRVLPRGRAGDRDRPPARRRARPHVTRAVYSPLDVDPDAAHRSEQLELQIDEIVRSRLPWQQRLMERVDPREARWLAPRNSSA